MMPEKQPRVSFRIPNPSAPHMIGISPIGCFAALVLGAALLTQVAGADPLEQSVERPAGQFAVPGQRTSQQPEPTGESLVRTELLAETGPIRAGEPFRIAIVFTLQPGWHIYWRNAGDSGGPPTIRLELPEGFVPGPVQWPAPRVFEEMGETTFGYEHRAVLFIPITPPGDLESMPSDLSITADLRWLVCKEVCLLGRRSERLTLTVDRSAGEPSEFQIDPRLIDAAARLPRPAGEVGVKAVIEGDVLVLTGPAGEGKAVAFLPMASPGVEFERTLPAPTISRAGLFTLRVPFAAHPHNALGEPMRIAGAVLVGDSNRPDLYTEFELPLELPLIPGGDPAH